MAEGPRQARAGDADSTCNGPPDDKITVRKSDQGRYDRTNQKGKKGKAVNPRATHGRVVSQG